MRHTVSISAGSYDADLEAVRVATDAARMLFEELGMEVSVQHAHTSIPEKPEEQADAQVVELRRAPGQYL